MRREDRDLTLLKRALLCLSLLTCSLGLWLRWEAEPAAPRAWFEDAPRPLVLAHQGGEKEWPSNTMHAFEKAYRLGADVLDTDLQMSRDGVLVLIHDTTVDRTTNGHGKVAELDWAELEKLDAAYRFSLDGKTFPLRGQGIRLARLDETLDAFPQWRLQIEVKQAPSEIVKRLADLLQDKNAEERVLLSCFDPAVMAALRRSCPNVASSATPSEIRVVVLASWLHLESLVSPEYSCFQVPLEHSGLGLVTRRTVSACHSRGVKVLPWTLDTDTEVERCRAAGADGFNTNLPSRMLRYRRDWGKGS